jgi:hypothetical protein
VTSSELQRDVRPRGISVPAVYDGSQKAAETSNDPKPAHCRQSKDSIAVNRQGTYIPRRKKSRSTFSSNGSI